MFFDIPDEELEALFDEWMNHRYFDRVLLSTSVVVGLMMAPLHILEIIFAPLFFPFYLWGLLPLK